MRTFSNAVVRRLLTLAVAGLGLAVTPSVGHAATLNDFTLDINAVASSIDTEKLLIADKFVGNYSEVLTVTGANTFATEAYWDLGQIVFNDGNTPYQASQTLLGTDYNIYATFSSTGTFAPDGSGGFNFLGGTGTIALWLDANADGGDPDGPGGADGKLLPATAPGAITIPNTGDDVKLATATLFSGNGSAPGNCDPFDPLCGSFGLIFNPFELEPLGEQFFVAPVPFYMTVILKGQFNFFVPEGTQLINGSADAYFENTVPEPATLSLLGLGLLGSGVAARRRRKSEAKK